MQRVLSAATVTAVGLTCKAYLTPMDSTHTNTRHLCLCADDPLTWGILPARTYLHSHLTRWTLGASDIMFTNPVFSAFFRKGQVIETFRGAGVYQPAVDLAIEKLRAGAWVHTPLGEGKVCQSDTYKADPQTGIARLQRFKWGITHPPTIIPMWITAHAEGRRAPWKFLPRPGARLSVTFGAPLSPAAVCATMASGTGLGLGPWRDGETEVKVRVALTELVQRAVEGLGRQVSGDMLNGSRHHQQRT
ncbi:hypothetical protein BJV77DRAFT_1061507 [Russula vinacea]|nr:hypothetical protein BJV77DRAFT_1061507 [Russula vinacea]